jgi:hypothetical protein
MNFKEFWRQLSVGSARHVWWITLGVMFVLGRDC